MSSRIECYIHSDTVVANKGVGLVELGCETDFAAKTEEFIAFAKKLAKLIYAFGSWDGVVEHMPEIKDEMNTLSKELREKIIVIKSHVFTSTPPSCIRYQDGYKSIQCMNLIES